MKPSTDSEGVEQEAARWFVSREKGEWTDTSQSQLDAWLEHDLAHRIAFIRLEAAWKHCARLVVLGAGVAPGVIPPRGSWSKTRFFRGRSPETHPPPSSSNSVEPQGLQLSRGLSGCARSENGPDDAVHSDDPLHRRTSRKGRLRLLALAAISLNLVFGFHRHALADPVVGDASRPTHKTGPDHKPSSENRDDASNPSSRGHLAEDKDAAASRGPGGSPSETPESDAKSSPMRMAAMEQLSLNISAQPLESALREFSAQSGLQLLFSSEATAMRRAAPAMTGFHTPPEALDQLLADTGLRYEYVNSRTVAIRSTAASPGFLSSRNGYVVFDGAALADVVSEFNRNDRRKIFIEDPALAAVRLGGNFRTDNSEAFLWLLENGFQVKVERTEDKVVLK